MIRKPQPSDLGRILELCALHAAFEQADFDRKGKEKALAQALFSSPPLLHCLLIEYEGTVEAYASFLPQYSTWDAAHYLYLDCLFLTKRIRGKGYGKQLMQAVHQVARQLDCYEIQWQTPDFNQRAIEFYQRLGAQAKSKERFFWQI